MARRSRRKAKVKPIFSAFIWGVLTGIGIDPGQMLYEAAVRQFSAYFQFAALVILVVAVYFSYNSILEAIGRSRRAYRMCGIIGVVAILLAFVAGFFVFAGGEKAVLAFIIAIAMWLYAQLK